ncbi:MAG: hypothetical protein KGL13_00645 [Gammaproteobacteria bacterium]|nr:hypothetical protein [Gammaproteobacteria bacterium]MDE2344952.1 hypothetical protein [Gammaproteobacteria bacterium]
MTAKHLKNPPGILTGMRRAHWFARMACAAVLCTVGLYTIGSTHHHKTLTGELHCPVCQVMAHGVLEVFTPAIAPMPPAIPLYYLGIARLQTRIPHRISSLRYQPRAPPAA